MHDWWPEGTVADVIESSEAMSGANGDPENGLPEEYMWFRLVPAEEDDEEEEEKKAIIDPYMPTLGMPSTTITEDVQRHGKLICHVNANANAEDDKNKKKRKKRKHKCPTEKRKRTES